MRQLAPAERRERSARGYTMKKPKPGKGTPKRRYVAPKRKPPKRAPERPPAPGSGPSSMPPVSPVGLERTIADLTRALRSRSFDSMEELNEFLRHASAADLFLPEPSTPLEHAQQLVYDAWDARGPRRTELAREALAISPDCCDAYMVLADEASSPVEVKELLEQAVAAGERALGPEFFEEYVGHFWGMVESRPYMRARKNLALALWNLEERDRAVEHFEDMLRLNPFDNQGIRYDLARCLLEAGDDAKLGALLARFDDDESTNWLFTRALWTFRVHGDTAAATLAIADALESNAAVPPFLFGLWQLPPEPPKSYSPGDENEAALYVGYCGEYWHETPGAMEWFAAYLELVISTLQRESVKKPRPRKAPAKDATATAGKLCQLKVTLRGVKPPIWRRVLVHPDTSLSVLHDILQIAMGWTDSHLHMFRAGKLVYGEPDPEFSTWMLDERKAAVRKLLPRTGSKAVYEYDFGDGWEHEILFEKVVEAEPGASYPVCTAGRRACPPEDCGGAWGYINLLDAIRDPDHEDHEEMRDWLDESFDPEAFDADEVNEGLASLRT